MFKNKTYIHLCFFRDNFPEIFKFLKLLTSGVDAHQHRARKVMETCSWKAEQDFLFPLLCTARFTVDYISLAAGA